MIEAKAKAELPACPVETTLTLIGDKWKVLILRDLMPGTKRFGELKKSVGNVSQKVLTAQLRAMEESGLVNRKVYAEVPPRVEYSLTELGKSLKPILDSMRAWGEAYKAKRVLPLADFFRRKCHLVLFHWRNNTKIALYPLGVVIVNVIPNHPNKLLLGSKTAAIIFLALQDAPESLHWAIVNAVSHARHTLRHTGFLQHMVKGLVGVLKTTVTVEQLMCIRMGFNCSLECVKHNRVVVVVTNNIRNDTSVVQVKDGTQIDFVNSSYHLNSITSVSHFIFGLGAWKLRPSTFSATYCGLAALFAPYWVNSHSISLP